MTDGESGGRTTAVLALLVVAATALALSLGAGSVGAASTEELNTNFTVTDSDEAVLVDYNTTNSATVDVSVYGINESDDGSLDYANKTEVSSETGLSGDGIAQYPVNSSEYPEYQVVVTSSDSTNVSSVSASLVYAGGGGGGVADGIDQSTMLIVGGSLLGLLVVARILR
jgi:hypothetical protein